MGANIRRTCAESETEESLLTTQTYFSDEIQCVAEDRTHKNVRPLHVLTLTPFYPSVDNPAEGCFVAEPLNLTEKFGIENHVIAVQSMHRPLRQLLDSGIHCESKRYLCIPGNFGLSTAGRFAASSLLPYVATLHRHRKIDMVHAHAALPCGQAAAMIGKRLGIPFVVTAHGLDVFSAEQAGPVLSRWCRKSSERVYERAAAIICISDKVRKQFDASCTKKCVLIHNGVDPQMFLPTSASNSPLTILSVGNLIPTKDHALLLRAFARIRHLVPDCRIEIIGLGPERDNLHRLAERLRISQQVNFLGRCTRAEVAAAMQRCSIFVLPSRYEGLGCVYLEAMSCGKPAIGCLQQGIGDVIHNGTNGFLVEPGDEQQLGDAMLALLQNQNLCQRIGAAARDSILQNCTLEHQARSLAALYRKCAA